MAEQAQITCETLIHTVFGFSTILYNYYLGENSLSFLGADKQAAFTDIRVAIIALVCWGALTDQGTVFAFADVTMAFLALANLFALILLFRQGLRFMRDYDAQIAEGIEQPRFDATRFNDLDIDKTAWTLEPEELPSETLQAETR